jgi:hypothetical protein
MTMFDRDGWARAAAAMAQREQEYRDKLAQRIQQVLDTPSEAGDTPLFSTPGEN